MVFVDSNVILDVITDDSRWGAWSAAQLAQALDAGPVLINAIVYAEIAFACARIEEVDALLPQHLYAYRPIPREASFLAARAHADYCQRGGQRSMNLPDFLIGAHALLEAKALLTRDGHRYRQAFPRLRLVLPEGPPP